MSKLDNEKERLRNFLTTASQNQFLYTLLCIGAVCLIIGFTVGVVSKHGTKPTVKIDTVFIEKPKLGGELSANTVILGAEEEDEDPVIPIPPLTKYKVTDWVCAWGKWSGVVRGISWSEKNPGILVYEVQHWNEEEKEWIESEYFDTELEPGKCN